MLLITILTGLSLSCCDPDESFRWRYYQTAIQNDSSVDIRLVYHSLSTDKEGKGGVKVRDTISLSTNKKVFFGGGGGLKRLLWKIILNLLLKGLFVTLIRSMVLENLSFMQKIILLKNGLSQQLIWVKK